MRTALLFCFCIAMASRGIWAQIPGRASGHYTFTATGRQISPALPIPLSKTAHFIAFTLRCSGADTSGSFDLRASADGRSWGDWQTLTDDAHADRRTGVRQFELLFLPADSRFVQIRSAGVWATLAGDLIFYSPLQAPDTDPAPVQPPPDRFACPCPQPAYVNRAGWGGPPTQQPGCTPAYTSVTHLIVHHQAGVADPPYSAVIQAIWQLHVYTNGWCDIGYNWLIAPDGTVFEGRAGGNNVLGAHFCGTNGNTMGVCFLGNYQTEQPTAAAQASLVKLLAWKCCDSNIEPTGVAYHAGSGLTLNRISGHRDGCSTLCPGDNLYVRLPILRLQTDSLYHDPTGCDGIWPPANDNCAGATLLTSAESCHPLTSNTAEATASGVPVPTCNGFTSGSALDVWFQFTAVEPKHRVTVTPLGQAPAALDPVVAVYDAGCNTPQLLACADAPGGSGGVTVLNLDGLVPGLSYWVRVFDFGNAPAADGRFDICIQHGASVLATEPAHAIDWQLYPNPSAGTVVLRVPGLSAAGGLFRLFDLQGRLVAQTAVLQQETPLSLQYLPPGAYRAELQTGAVLAQRLLVLTQ